jgi:hypothetical protein
LKIDAIEVSRGQHHLKAHYLDGDSRFFWIH